MLLQRVWQTAYNLIFRIRQIIVGIYIHVSALEEGLLYFILADFLANSVTSLKLAYLYFCVHEVLSHSQQLNS
jgi:hypothetical protein